VPRRPNDRKRTGSANRVACSLNGRTGGIYRSLVAVLAHASVRIEPAATSCSQRLQTLEMLTRMNGGEMVQLRRPGFVPLK